MNDLTENGLYFDGDDRYFKKCATIVPSTLGKNSAGLVLEERAVIPEYFQAVERAIEFKPRFISADQAGYPLVIFPDISSECARLNPGYFKEGCVFVFKELFLRKWAGDCWIDHLCGHCGWPKGMLESYAAALSCFYRDCSSARCKFRLHVSTLCCKPKRPK